eukprot:COSAG02_NODE_9858_length_2090_cov_1.909091_1_plen_50_part_10
MRDAAALGGTPSAIVALATAASLFFFANAAIAASFAVLAAATSLRSVNAH